MRFSLQKLIIFLLLLFLFFLIYYKYSNDKNKNIIESYDNIYIYDSIYITNNINDNIIVITSMNIKNGNLEKTINENGFNIFLTSSNINSVPTYYTKMNFNLNGQIDIVDIHSGNGHYWYFNYGTEQGHNKKNSCPKELGKEFKPIDLSLVPKSHIFENGIKFQNGSILTFDITGKYLVFERAPEVMQSNSIQAIFNLGDNRGSHLLGNNMIILNQNLDSPANYYYYNGSCNSNNSRPNPKDGGTINNVQTRGIYISGNKQSILQFNNGCFIDGSRSSSIIRFVGNNGVVQFDFSGSYDIFQIWNIIQSTYFYYNQKHQSGTSKAEYSSSTQSQKNRNYWNTLKTGLLPYTPFIEKLIYDNALQFSYIDQIIIYNPSSTNQNAILMQVDTSYYNHFHGNNLPQGNNNYSISINSIIYDPKTGKVKTNPKSISRFLFNFNNSNGDIVNFTNGGHYFYYNYNGSHNNTKIHNGTTNITLCPNNMVNRSNSHIPTQKNPYAFRIAKTFRTPNLLVFENTINFHGGLQIGIDSNGNCIWKGKTGQIEFILSKHNIGSNNINIFALKSDGGMDHGKMTYGNNFSNKASNLPTNSTPLKLNSTSTTNIINGNSVSLPISRLVFSNRMMMETDGTNLWLQGIFGSFVTTLNSSSGNLTQFQNNTWDNKGSKGLTLGYSFGMTTSDSHVKNYKNGSNFSIINSTTGSSIGITKGILHYIGSWGDCGLSGKDLSVRPIFQASGDFLVGTNMSSKKDILSDDTENNTKFSCKNVTKLNPISNNLIVSFPNGYSDNKGKSIVKGGVCIIEPIGGIIHYIRKWGDCGISDKGIDIISIKENTGNLLVGDSMSSRTNKQSSDTTTGWPCTEVTRLDPVKTNLVVSFPNGYKDIHGESIIKGGDCIIEPVNPQFLFL